MIIDEVKSALVELPPPTTPRSVGIHASGLIRGIALETGILKAAYAEELSLVDVRAITDPIAILRISIGLAWEEWYIPRIAGVTNHPGELEVDGIYMTPDGESLDSFVAGGRKQHRLTIHEVKATYKSIKTVGDFESQWMWLAQVMAYCKGAGTRHVRQHVLFLCGDYTYPITPQLKVWELEFTEKEIEDNWGLLTEYRLKKERVQ